MSGLLERLADLANRTLATARAMPPARPDDEQAAADARPDASSAPAWALAEPRQASDHGDEAADDSAHAASQRGAPDAASQGATGEARPATPEPIFAPQPTEAGPTRPTAEGKAPTNEAGQPETDFRVEPPAPPGVDAGSSLQPRDRAPRPLEPVPAPASAEADQTASPARPGLLRDVEIRVVSPLGAAPGAPIGPQPGHPLPGLKERWRELGARLRATHPPTGRGTEREEATNGEAATRPEVAVPPVVPYTRRQAQLAANEAGTAPRRSDLIIRHLEIRIVAAAKETAPAGESRPPEPLAGAWQTAARRYLRL